ncbi:hypothetical protein [Falsiphaeobacter marinintestinus]|uniref:hypothetical protein n=1 Tax=Falsiphaeobacter marinintestinus TaxID=1492905 RepID=UPI0011B79C84|nr:hypothetical protein [Phaeobacter marinintestinus]
MSTLFPKLASFRRAFVQRPAAVLALPAPKPQRSTLPDLSLLDIPIRDLSSDGAAARAAFARGQFLARQDRWEDLSGEIMSADADRQKTPAGMPIADLMAYGARADVVQAAEHALFEERPANDTPLVDGIAALEQIRSEFSDDPYITAIVAMTHVDIGWTWRGSGQNSVLPQLNRDRCVAHFDRAFEILNPFCGIELNSPLIASTRCALLAGSRDPLPRLADDYEDLIDLDPENHRPMRALGNHMLPQWFGTYGALDLEARRTAARTQDIWGAGGYTWVCFDAMAQDERVCEVIDTEFFIEGLRDIVKARPDQETVNLLAAFCAVTLRSQEGLDINSDLARFQIADCASWLIRDHLTELHPLIWAHASEGFDNNARIMSPSRFAARGRSHGLMAIAEQFRDDIDRGLRVTFTPDGPQVGPA